MSCNNKKYTIPKCEEIKLSKYAKMRIIRNTLCKQLGIKTGNKFIDSHFKLK